MLHQSLLPERCYGVSRPFTFSPDSSLTPLRHGDGNSNGNEGVDSSSNRPSKQRVYSLTLVYSARENSRLTVFWGYFLGCTPVSPPPDIPLSFSGCFWPLVVPGFFLSTFGRYWTKATLLTVFRVHPLRWKSSWRTAAGASPGKRKFSF